MGKSRRPGGALLRFHPAHELISQDADRRASVIDLYDQRIPDLRAVCCVRFGGQIRQSRGHASRTRTQLRTTGSATG
jgi:hypothetical protein